MVFTKKYSCEMFNDITGIDKIYHKEIYNEN